MMISALSLAQSPKSEERVLDPEACLLISPNLDKDILLVASGSEELGGDPDASSTPRTSTAQSLTVSSPVETCHSFQTSIL
ncbi:hypothetical protein ABG768_025748, partial [Culter alburnus]